MAALPDAPVSGRRVPVQPQCQDNRKQADGGAPGSVVAVVVAVGDGTAEEDVVSRARLLAGRAVRKWDVLALGARWVAKAVRAPPYDERPSLARSLAGPFAGPHGSGAWRRCRTGERRAISVSGRGGWVCMSDADEQCAEAMAVRMTADVRERRPRCDGTADRCVMSTRGCR